MTKLDQEKMTFCYQDLKQAAELFEKCAGLEELTIDDRLAEHFRTIARLIRATNIRAKTISLGNSANPFAEVAVVISQR